VQPVKVAVLDDYLGVLRNIVDWSVLPAGTTVDIFEDHLSAEDDLVARLVDHGIIVGMRERTPFRATLIDRLPNLKLLVTLGSANPSFDISHATKRGIVVAGTGASGVDPIELTWALILAAARHVPHEDRAVRLGQWQTKLGTRLAGKTLGLLGLGRIGGAVAPIGRAFGMKVIAWSENLTLIEAETKAATAVGKDELFSQADILSVHLRLSGRTRGMVGPRELALMKPTAFLVNTARGEIVDEAALIDALKGGRIAGAALDVFDEEPLPPGHPFLALDNVILTPHLGGVTVERYRADYTEVIEDISAFLAGRPIRVLNPDVLRREPSDPLA
jgi:phosphoglycerate dehydrogenase-like enzyme